MRNLCETARRSTCAQIVGDRHKRAARSARQTAAKIIRSSFSYRQDDCPAWRIVGVRQASPNAASGLVQGTGIGVPIPAANFLEFVGQAAQHRAADAEEA